MELIRTITGGKNLAQAKAYDLSSVNIFNDKIMISLPSSQLFYIKSTKLNGNKDGGEVYVTFEIEWLLTPKSQEIGNVLSIFCKKSDPTAMPTKHSILKNKYKIYNDGDSIWDTYNKVEFEIKDNFVLNIKSKFGLTYNSTDKTISVENNRPILDIKTNFSMITLRIDGDKLKAEFS